MKDRFIFENNFEDELIVTGERLFENNGIKDVQQLEKGLYILLIKDDIIHETEVLHPFTKRQKFTCDCNYFEKNNKCQHIVATLFELRRRIQETKKKKSKKSEDASKSIKHNKLNIATILEYVSVGELKSFISAYANKNQKFATALKVNFASKIDLEDNNSKYKQLLDSIIRPVTSKSKKVGAADIKSLISVCKDLNDQYQDAIALNQYSEAFIIIENVLKKIEYTKYNFDILQKELNQLSKTFHSHFITLLSENIAPELMTKIQSFLLDLGSMSYYSYDDSLLNVAQIINEYTKCTQSIRNSLIETINERLNKNNLKDSIPVLYAVLQNLKYQDIKEPIEISPNHIKHSVAIIDNLIKLEALDEANILIDVLLVKDDRNKNLHFKYLELLILQNKQVEFIDQASNAFLKFRDFRIIDAIVKSMDSKQQKKAFDFISSELNNSTEYYFRAKYYLKVNDQDALTTLLEEQKDFRLLMSYDKYLIQDNHKRIKELYILILKEYLDIHIGKHSTEFISEISHHLQSINAFKILTAVNKFIIKNYAHRVHFITSVK